jgi:hypothetical protein
LAASGDKASTVRISNPISAIHLNALSSRAFLCSFLRVTRGGQTRKTTKSDKVKKYVYGVLCIFYIRIVTFMQQNHNVQQRRIIAKSCIAVQLNFCADTGPRQAEPYHWLSLAEL